MKIFCNKYTVYRSDRNFAASNRSRGGGVLVAVNNLICSAKIDVSLAGFDSSPTIDIAGVKLYSANRAILIFIVYIPPNTSVATYETIFDLFSILDGIQSKNVILVGDFNITHYASYLRDEHANGLVSAFLNLMNTCALSQYNFEFNSNDKILDLVLCNSYCTVEKCIDPLVAEDNHL